MQRNMTVVVEGVEYVMALLGKDADAVAVPGGVLVYLDLGSEHESGGKVNVTTGKVGQLTMAADSGGFRPVAGVEAKVSCGSWRPRPLEVVQSAVKATSKAGRIGGKA